MDQTGSPTAYVAYFGSDPDPPHVLCVALLIRVSVLSPVPLLSSLVICASLVICVSLVIRMHLWRARWARARALSYGQELFSKNASLRI